jgi:signal transduction histidine kinase
MIEPAHPANEIYRQKALSRYSVLESEPEAAFDNIAELMAHISGAPICLIAFLDGNRNWFKSHYGVDLTESPRAISFCGHASNEREPIMVVENTRTDVRFHDNPLVTESGVAFYAGVPLVTPDGYKIGTLCVFDLQPRALCMQSQNALITLGKQVEALLQLRLQNRALLQSRAQLQSANLELAHFAGSVAHDLKTPISNIINMAELIERQIQLTPAARPAEWLKKLKSTSRGMSKYIDDLLDFYTQEKIGLEPARSVALQDLLADLKRLTVTESEVQLVLPTDEVDIAVNHTAVMQILLNLVTNAIKYCDKPRVEITIAFAEKPDAYEFIVQDNGRGIAPELLPNLFDVFNTGQAWDRQGNSGTGIGLSNVKRLVQRGGGELSVQSTPGLGSVFRFTVAKAPS